MSVKRTVCDECGSKLADRRNVFKAHQWVGSLVKVSIQFIVSFNTYENLDICEACAKKAIKLAAKKL